MNKKVKQKQIGHYLATQFFILSLSCFVFIFILSFLIIRLNSMQVLNEAFAGNVKWISDRILLLTPFAFIFCIFVILFYQRRQLIKFIAELATAFETVNINEKPDFHLPAILKETEESIAKLQREMKEKEHTAREAEQRKNDLIVYLAHDLKTPISSIIGYLTLLRDEKEISEEMHQKFVHVALNNAERLDDLINEFFEITRYNLSNVSLNYSKVIISRMLEQLMFEFHPILENKKLTYRIEGYKDIQLVCDAEKIQRVFDNLISNAVHYSFENSEIVITVLQVETNLRIQFSNQGYPIEQDKINRIFEQFYRLDASRSTRNGGKGLGLAIAKQIIEQHNGLISATSEGDQIAITVTLPTS